MNIPVLKLLIVMVMCYQMCNTIRSKWRFIYLGETKTHWNDGVVHCSDVYSGSLLTVESIVVQKVMLHYVNTVWNNSWKTNTSVWNGLYVNNTYAPSGGTGVTHDHIWQGICAGRTFYLWDQEPMFSEDKKCTEMNPTSLRWLPARCNESRYSVCEQFIGNCTYEMDSNPMTCALGANPTQHQNIATLKGCKDLCDADDECWAVNYDGITHECWLSSSTDPFDFDPQRQIYKNPCSHSVLLKPKLYWRRCFDHLLDLSEVHTYDYTDPLKPIALCETETLEYTTTTATAQQNPTTTTSAQQHPTTTSTVQQNPITTSTVQQNPITMASAQQTPTTSASAQQIPTTTTSAQHNPATDTQVTTTTIQSTASSSTPQASVADLQTSCYCMCRPLQNISSVETVEEIVEKLKLDKKETSLHKRKYISAEDDRPSAKGIGLTLGMGTIVSVVVALTISDCLHLFKWLHKKLSVK